MTDLFPSDDEIDAIFKVRPGHPTHHENPVLESIDLHELVEFISPKEMMNALLTCVYSTPEIVQTGSGAVIEIPCEFGIIYIRSTDPSCSWSEETPSSEFEFVMQFNGIYINDVKLNTLNQKYNKFQLLIVDGEFKARSHHTMRGARTLENLLWTLVHHFQDAERVYKDLTLYPDE